MDVGLLVLFILIFTAIAWRGNLRGRQASMASLAPVLLLTLSCDARRRVAEWRTLLGIEEE
jgi:hypothetical protein